MPRSAVLVFALSMGCSAPRPPNVPIPATAELHAIQKTTWLVRRVTFDEPAAGRVAGYDVDRLDSGQDGDPLGNCEAFNPDFVSELDPGITGVDNSGAYMIAIGESFARSSTFEEALDGAVREGRVRWALRVGELDESETSLVLELFVIDEAEPLAFDADGLPAAGQRLRARRIAHPRASVRRHVAWAYTETTELTIPGDTYLLPFDDFRLGAFGIAAGASPEELRGNLGGSFSVNAVFAATLPLVTFTPADLPSIRQLIAGFADLEPSAEDPQLCERISVGFGFEAVPVELVIE